METTKGNESNTQGGVSSAVEKAMKIASDPNFDYSAYMDPREKALFLGIDDDKNAGSKEKE